MDFESVAVIFAGTMAVAITLSAYNQMLMHRRMLNLERSVRMTNDTARKADVASAAVIDLDRRIERVDAYVRWMRSQESTRIQPVLENPTPMEEDVSLLERRGWVATHRSDEGAQLTMSEIGPDGESKVRWFVEYGNSAWHITGADGIGVEGLDRAADVLLWIEGQEMQGE